jgi:hypothetical protein
VSRLYLNDQLVQSGSYARSTPNWTAASVFALGAYEYVSLGGWNVLDDVVDEFTVNGPTIVGDASTLRQQELSAPADRAVVTKSLHQETAVIAGWVHTGFDGGTAIFQDDTRSPMDDRMYENRRKDRLRPKRTVQQAATG